MSDEAHGTSNMIETYGDIERMLNQLEKKRYDDRILPVKEAAKLAVAFNQPWIFTGEKAAIVSLESIEEKAKSDAAGVPTIPDSSATVPGGIEKEVIDIYSDWHDDVYLCFNRFSALMRERMQGLENDINQMLSAIDRDPDNHNENYYSNYIQAANTQLKFQTRDKLDGIMDQFRETKNLFVEFRRAHGLRRNPKYEPSLVAFSMIAIICVVLETAVNGFMYAQASDLGLIGGWGVAAGLSTIIFSLSFVAGWVLTQKNGLLEQHSTDRPDWKESVIPPIRGWGGFLATSTVVLMLISFVCVYRDEASMSDASGTTHPMTETLRRLPNLDILPKADIEGILLIFVNLAIMLISMYKGYNHFDTVPGYRDHAEQLAKERKRFREAIGEASSSLGITSNQLDRIEQSLHEFTYPEINSVLDWYKRGLTALAQLRESINIQVRKLTEDCNDRLTAYREQNKTHRPAPYPPPPYFKETWKPPASPILDNSWNQPLNVDDVDSNKLAGKLMEHRKAAIQIIREQAQKRYEELIQKYYRESESAQYEVNQKEA